MPRSTDHENERCARAIQAVGLACVPLHNMPAAERVLARRPVAAAVLTLQRRSDGHREIVAAAMSDARHSEFPLAWLIDRALMPSAPTIYETLPPLRDWMQDEEAM